jgi:serum/glucocorticoid-regulated kinase 2
MAPEILTPLKNHMQGKENAKIVEGYGLAVDWWAIGCLCYEMIIGVTPFYDSECDKFKIFNNILNKQVHFPDESKYKIAVSDDCKDFMIRLLDKNPETRLGSQDGIDEIMNHAWMQEIDLETLLKKGYPPPYLPKLSENPLDVDQFDEDYTLQEASITVQATTFSPEE